MTIPKGMEKVVFSWAYYKVNDFEKVSNFFIKLSEKGFFGAEKENYKKQILIGSFIRNYPKSHWNPMANIPGAKQVVGGAEIKNGVLKIETNTKGGLKSIRDILDNSLGNSIEFQREEFKDPMKMLEK